MKELKLKISDEVYQELKNTLIVSHMCQTNVGIPFELCKNIAHAFEHNLSILELTMKKKKK